MDPKNYSNDVNETASESQSLSRVEWFLGLTVALLLSAVAIPGVGPIAQPSFDDPTVRGLEGLLLRARAEAIQTGDDHIVFFRPDVSTLSFPELEVSELMALLIRDRDGDGGASEAEYVASVPIDSSGGVEWGTAMAARPANGDGSLSLASPLSFPLNDAGKPGHELVFRSDGAPIVNGTASPTGVPTSGAGTAYLRSATRDYAVVLSPWGDVDVQVWDVASGTWQVAIGL